MSFNKLEIHCLVYEIVCSRLLQHFEIPTPEIAIATLNKDSYDVKSLKRNRRKALPGSQCFASKEIIDADLLRDTEIINRKKEFNKYSNKQDLIRIALFDLWVDNKDRKEGNYNLLTHLENDRKKIYAFDHAFTFGGLEELNIFNPNSEVSPYKKLITSIFFKSFVKHLTKAERLYIVKEFVSRIKDSEPEIKDIIEDVFKQIPAEWQVQAGLKERIIGFLLSPIRIQKLNLEAVNILKKTFKI
ncbi:MAG: hypothetical protein EKK37_08615 [Sphingobacteriales bacterium]|nr:MAG: hypothetical protein EKK37_08615 [Sphingobacteriales bacterium]